MLFILFGRLICGFPAGFMDCFTCAIDVIVGLMFMGQLMVAFSKVLLQ